MPNNNFIKDFFSFSKRERNGIYILIGLIILAHASSYLWQYLVKPKSYSYEVFNQEIEAFEQSQKTIVTKDTFKKALPAKKQANATPKKKLIISLNTADTNGLKEIKGIGPVYASRIVKYRALLGGYSRKNQLLEVYGIDTALYEKIKNHVSIDTADIKHLDLNKSDFKTLLRHPYLSMNQVKSITSRRDSAKFSNLEELKKVQYITDRDYARLQPYLYTTGIK